jgi:DNA-binding transcriptional LysR family regulator
MELRQLQYFVAVVEEANFTRAAAKLHVAQPGVSAQIRQLERELGQELLDRSGRTVRPTEAGAAALPYARAALSAVAGARSAVDELAGLMRGHVTIGTVTSISSKDIDLPGLLASFHDQHPDVEITLAAANTDDLITALQAGRLDLALIGLSTAAPPGLATQILTSERLVAVVSHTHPLSTKNTITLKALAEQTLISLPRGTGLRACLDEACGAARLRPQIAFEAGDPRILAALAARGLGVALVPQSIAGARQAQLHTINITRPTMHGEIALAWRNQGPSSPAARALITQARGALTRESGER